MADDNGCVLTGLRQIVLPARHVQDRRECVARHASQPWVGRVRSECCTPGGDSTRRIVVLTVG